MLVAMGALCGLSWIQWLMYSSTRTFASSRVVKVSLFSGSLLLIGIEVEPPP